LDQLGPDVRAPNRPIIKQMHYAKAIAGLVIGLIALYSSYDHVNFFCSTIHLNQQWGVWLIVTSLAVVAIDAQLASRSRLGEENRKIQDERTAAEAAERQGQGIALLRSAALLSPRVQLDPSELNLIGSAGAGVMGLCPGAGMDRGSPDGSIRACLLIAKTNAPTAWPMSSSRPVIPSRWLMPGSQRPQGSLSSALQRGKTR
jgi:hypothetical protein